MPEKQLPSGVSPYVAYTLWREHGGIEDCLEPVDVSIVDAIKDELSEGFGDKFITDYGVPDDFVEKAETVYNSLAIAELTLQNVWSVFQAMLPRLDNAL